MKLLATKTSALALLVTAGALLGVSIQAYIQATETVSYLPTAMLFTSLTLSALAGFIDLWKNAVQTKSNAV